MVNNKNINIEKITLYYADWCPHCKDIQPEWDELEKRLKDNPVNGKKIKVQRYEEGSIPQGTEIKGFPTVKVTDENGNEYECNCERKAEAYINFLKNPDFTAQTGGGRKSILADRYGNMSRDDFYKMKYYKYKAKLAKLQMHQ